MFDYKNKETSEENLTLLKKVSHKYETYIVSGNSFEHIAKAFGGSETMDIAFTYTDNGMIEAGGFTREEYIIKDEEQKIIEKLLENTKYEKISCGESALLYRIKNVYEGRDIEIQELNKKLPIGLKAFQRGVASVEIHKEFVTKLDYISKEIDLTNCLYLGDENLGNDEIFFRLYNCIKISDIRVTNAFLKALDELK